MNEEEMICFEGLGRQMQWQHVVYVMVALRGKMHWQYVIYIVRISPL